MAPRTVLGYDLSVLGLISFRCDRFHFSPGLSKGSGCRQERSIRCPIRACCFFAGCLQVCGSRDLQDLCRRDLHIKNQMLNIPHSIVDPSRRLDELEVKRADQSKEELPEYPPPLASRLAEQNRPTCGEGRLGHPAGASKAEPAQQSKP